MRIMVIERNDDDFRTINSGHFILDGSGQEKHMIIANGATIVEDYTMNFEASRPFDIVETREFVNIYRGENESGQKIAFWRPIQHGAYSVGDVFIQTDLEKPEMVANMIVPNPRIEGFESLLRVPDSLNHVFTTGSYGKVFLTNLFFVRPQMIVWQ